MGESEPKLAPALSKAEEIIKSAETRAKEILLEAEKQLEKSRKEGYEEGVEQGRRDAVESAVRLIEDSDIIVQNLATEAARLSLAITRNVIAEEVSLKPDLVKAIALQAIQESIVGESAVIVVHPEDKKTLEQSYDNFRRLAGGANVAIEADDRISRGGCLVRTEFGEVDAQIDSLLDSIATRLGL